MFDVSIYLEGVHKVLLTPGNFLSMKSELLFFSMRTNVW